MPRVLPVSLASNCGGCYRPPVTPSHSWSREGSDGSMLTRLKNWVQASRERKREPGAADYGSLSKQEQEEVRRLREEHTGALTSHHPDRELGSRPGT